ncbi:MAG: TIM44-like domain-containing protein [Clostridia bacterium]|nr:TIM44-like domain-containing protein [Clostridia bacterium]
MKKNFKILTVLLIAVAVLITLALPFSADLGDYSGGSDYGDWGSSSDYSSSYDYDSDYSGIPFVFGGGGGDFGIVILIVAAIIIFIMIKNKKSGGSTGPVAPGATGVDRSTLKPMSALKEEDPMFSDTNFKEKLSNLYVQMQNCCTAKDIEPLRPYLTDNLYNQFNRQIEMLKQTNRTNRIDRIAVLEVELLGYTDDSVNDTVYAQLKTRITDYIIDDKTGAVVSGSNTAEKFMVYEWALIRSKGKKTDASVESKIVNCPNCGAPVNLNHTAKCEYCGTVIASADFDWTLTSVKGISQRTSG